jgi:hypothetical protein
MGKPCPRLALTQPTGTSMVYLEATEPRCAGQAGRSVLTSRAARTRAFASWLGLGPDNRAENTVGQNTQGQEPSLPGHFAWLRNPSLALASHITFRPMGAKWGLPKAITAAAHNLARINPPYRDHNAGSDHETVCVQNEVQNCQCLEARLRKQARDLGLEIIPAKTGAL